MVAVAQPQSLIGQCPGLDGLHQLRDFHRPSEIACRRDLIFITQDMALKVTITRYERFTDFANFDVEPIHYSSTGVREQTAELSSSILSESEIATYLSPERNDPRTGQPRTHDTIEEGPELTSGPGSSEDAPVSSALTEAIRSQPQRRGTSASKSNAEMQEGTRVPDLVISDEDDSNVDESSALLPRERLPSHRKPQQESESDVEEQARYEPGTWNRLGHHYPSLRNARKRVLRIVRDPRKLARKVIVEPVFMLPAVFLGLLLNLLDALSYGIILFPLGEAPFKDLGADGVCMFYVSCIISQIVTSTGSIFRGGVGSEMIEVVPFFHKMTYLVRSFNYTSSDRIIKTNLAAVLYLRRHCELPTYKNTANCSC